LLNRIIEILKKKCGTVAVTAPTGWHHGRLRASPYSYVTSGIAAYNIGGVTIHSFAGIGLGNYSLDVMERRVVANAKALNRWKTTTVLIIDEGTIERCPLHSDVNIIQCPC
jgi:hypothetical protein